MATFVEETGSTDDDRSTFDDLKLIELISSERCLWDVSCEEYKDTELKNRRWSTIGSRLKIGGGPTSVCMYTYSYLKMYQML